MSRKFPWLAAPNLALGSLARMSVFASWGHGKQPRRADFGQKGRGVGASWPTSAFGHYGFTPAAPNLALGSQAGWGLFRGLFFCVLSVLGGPPATWRNFYRQVWEGTLGLLETLYE